jgi:hypothetical protein
MRYGALTEIQQPRLEIIESLQKMMERALGRFIELNKILVIYILVDKQYLFLFLFFFGYDDECLVL